MAELQEIMDEIVAIQGKILPPKDERDLAGASDELPVDLMTFPYFLNVEAATEVSYGSSLRIQRHEIDMNLVLGGADKKYSMRSRRKWVQAVLDAFASEVTLNGKVTQALIMRVDHATPLPWNEDLFAMVTFRLRAEVKEGVTFAG